MRPLLDEFLVDQLRKHESDTNTNDDGDQVDDDGVEDRADNRAEARKSVRCIIAWVCSVVTTFITTSFFFQNYPVEMYVIIPPPLSGISLVLSHIQAIILIIMTLHACYYRRLCTITHVKESKLLLKMIPMWSTFLSLTSKKGASNSQLKLGKIVRIWSRMVLCIIFCVVVDCLLQGSGIKGLEEFMIGELPNSLKNYALVMNGFVIDGIGNFLGILFSPDKYYLRLMILSFLNMCYYYPISIIYRPIHYARSDTVERDHITINQ
ncbi:hypothetical protein ACOSP7_006574 [Xanthoceras sorbifolium]